MSGRSEANGGRRASSAGGKEGCSISSEADVWLGSCLHDGGLACAESQFSSNHPNIEPEGSRCAAGRKSSMEDYLRFVGGPVLGGGRARFRHLSKGLRALSLR